MKKLVGFMTMLAIVSLCHAPLSAQSPADVKFTKMIDNYLDSLWKFSPTAATMAGFTKYNDKLEDLSEGAIEKRHDALDAFNQELVAKTDMTKLTPDNQLIYNILRDAIDLEFVKFENLLPWEYNPLFYNEIFVNSIRGLLTKDSAPLDARVKSAVLRAKLLPALIKKAKENLKTPAQIYTETAIKQMPAIIDFYKTEVPNLVSNAPGGPALLAETAKVTSALEDYATYLQNDLLPKSTGNFRVGDQVHLRMLRNMSQGAISLQELMDQAKADHFNIRKEMVGIASCFHQIMYPGVDQQKLGKNEEELKDIIIPRVFAKLRINHATKEEWIAKIAANAEAVKAFVAQTKLFDIPETHLVVEAMPAVSQGTMTMKLISPGAYDSNGSYSFQIAPIPADWSPEQVASYLEEYNNAFLPFFTVQKIFPGTFVPTDITRKDASVVKKLYANQSLLKGWPIYLSDLLITSGFGNYDLTLRMNQIEMLVKTIVEFQCDVNVHQGGMTKEVALSYMVRKGYMTPAEAELRWNHILLNPGEASLAYIGYKEIQDLAKKYQGIKGDAFTYKEFLQKILSFGAISPRDIASRLAQ